MIEISIRVFIGAIKREYELLPELLPGNEIEAQDNRRRNIVDVHRSLPKPARPVAIAGVDAAVPEGDKSSRAEGDHVHLAVLSIILGDQFGEDLAAPVPRIRPVNAGRGNEYDLVDAGRSGRFEDLEGAADIQVKEIVRIFLAPTFVDAVPGGSCGRCNRSCEIYRSTSSGPEWSPR